MSADGERKPGHHAAHRASGKPSGKSRGRTGGQAGTRPVAQPAGHHPGHRAGRLGAPEPLVRRLPVLLLVATLLVGGGVASAVVATPPAQPFHPAPAALAALTAPTASDASSWYCTGGSGPQNPIAQPTLYLVNSGNQAVQGKVTVYDGTGKSASRPVSVPALGEATVAPGSIVADDWLASRVDLQGGGVAVSELVAGSTGWSVAPCSSVAGPNWYFASGATTQGNALFVSLFNPTPSDAVVDLQFVTGKGVVQPSQFQGLIIDPGAVVTAQVAAYVQTQVNVATEVVARSGKVVAAELEVHRGAAGSGLSLRLGTPQPVARWYLPQSSNPPGGRSRLVVFNPGTTSARVTVAVQLPSGPVSPLTETVPPRSTWTLDLTQQSRIPPSTDYAVAVTTQKGGRIVVDRVAAAPPGAAAPQWGAVTAVAGVAAASPSGRWSLPNPALDATRAEPGARATTVTLLNPGGRTVRAVVGPLGSGRGARSGARTVRVRPHAMVEVATSSSPSTATEPIGVQADLPLAVVENVTPSGVVGAVSATGVPQS